LSLPADWDWKRPDYAPIWADRMERLARIRSGEVDIDALKAHYKENPDDFIHDWMVTSDPRNAEIGVEVVVPFLLFPKQREYIKWLHARWKGREDGLTEKSRDMGVSWLCCAFAVWMFIFHSGTVAGFGSRKEEYVDKIGDPKSLFWKMRTIIELLPSEFVPRHDAPFMRIVNFENGASIIGEAGDNIGRGNRTSIYFVDEAAFLEHPDLVDAALSQASNCKQYVSTPNGVGNPFYRKRHSGRVKVFVFDWKDDPRKDKAWYMKQVETLDDPVIVAQEIDRDYTASVSNSYINGKEVTAAQARGPADVMAVGPVIVGVDPARFGNDKSVITFRQGRVVYPQIVFGKTDVVDCAGRVADAIRLWPEPVAQIAVDTIGIGAGVADTLRRIDAFKDIVVDVNSSLRLDDGQNYNLRARMWRDMRTWLRNGASLPNDPELMTAMTALQYGYRGGELLIESKDDMKKRGLKSPDQADSIACTFAHPVATPPPPPPPSPGWSVIDNLTGY
jgi:phage terminase large subunit